MNPVPALLLCLKFGYALFALLLPDFAPLLVPVLQHLNNNRPAATGAIRT
jgi:hypothetical protein